MKISKGKDLIVSIEAKVVWRDPAKIASEQILRDEVNHRVRVMGNRFKYLIEDIIINMVDMKT